MRNRYYRQIPSRHAERLASFRQQMADFARGQLLVQLREQRHLTQDAAAYEIGTSPKSLRAWEHGGKIRWENAKRVAAYYGVDAEMLVTREEVSGDDGAAPTLLAVSADDGDIRAQLERLDRELTYAVEMLEWMGEEWMRVIRAQAQNEPFDPPDEDTRPKAA